MTSLSGDNQADIIEAFNSTSRYLDDLLNIYNPYFEGVFWFGLRLYVPVNNFSVMSGRSHRFLGITSTFGR